MNLHAIRYYFSLKQISKQRLKFQHKICFKTDLKHLRLKTTPSISVASRLYRDGSFLKMYKNLQKSFLYLLLPNVNQLAQNNEFSNLYQQYESFCDINRVLFWKLMSINSLFSLKKLSSKRILFYLRPERRAVLVLLWLKNIIKLRKFDGGNSSPKLFLPLLSFISANKNTNEIFSLKLKIYKIRLLRG